MPDLFPSPVDEHSKQNEANPINSFFIAFRPFSALCAPEQIGKRRVILTRASDSWFTNKIQLFFANQLGVTVLSRMPSNISNDAIHKTKGEFREIDDASASLHISQQ